MDARRTSFEVCVIVPARNSATTLAAAVASVVRQSGDVPVVIAVGPSSDSTAALADSLAAAHPQVRVVDNPDGGTAAGLNRAVAAATGSVLVRLDAHAILPAGYITTALEVLEARPEVGNVGGRQVPTAERGFAAGVAAAMRSPAGAGGAAYRTGSTAGPTDTVYLGVYRRRALEQVGGFDERMVRNQDYELNIRLRDAGWTVWFDPRLEVAYTPRGSVPALARQYFEYGRYRRLTARLHPGTLRLRQVAAPAIVIGLLASVVAGAVDGMIPAGATLAYATALLLAGIAAEPRRSPLVALALATMHLSWGVGFLLGPPRQADIS